MGTNKSGSRSISYDVCFDKNDHLWCQTFKVELNLKQKLACAPINMTEEEIPEEWRVKVAAADERVWSFCFASSPVKYSVTTK